MQWILQDYEDTTKLAEILERLGLNYSLHKVVPFVGEMDPHPVIIDPKAVVMFGSYSLRHYARKYNLYPGVFELEPFSTQKVWQPYLLNSDQSTIYLDLKDIPSANLTEELYFVRPVDDSKELSGAVMEREEIIKTARNVLALKSEEIVKGSLTHDSKLMLCEPVNIQKEWRVWVVDDRVVTYSLYRMGQRVIYRPEMDDDALVFAQNVVNANPGYAPAYVIDICRTANGLHILETNCINAAGFYAADLFKLIEAFENS